MIKAPEDLLPMVTGIEDISEYTLMLRFDNGELRALDCSYMLDLPPYKSKLQSVFTCARAEYGTVVWPCDLDISPETVYLKSVPVVKS